MEYSPHGSLARQAWEGSALVCLFVCLRVLSSSLEACSFVCLSSSQQEGCCFHSAPQQLFICWLQARSGLGVRPTGHSLVKDSETSIQYRLLLSTSIHAIQFLQQIPSSLQCDLDDSLSGHVGKLQWREEGDHRGPSKLSSCQELLMEGKKPKFSNRLLEIQVIDHWVS